MTIAACFVSSEGVVLGADSTSTMFVSAPAAQFGGEQHYNFAQKVFRIGESGTLGVTMWGLGGLPHVSHRTLLARFDDQLLAQSPMSMSEIAQSWSEFFWAEYEQAFGALLQRTQELVAKPQPAPDEIEELSFLKQNLSGGFCIGGQMLPDRQPQAFEIVFAPEQTAAATPKPLKPGNAMFWGCPNLIHRLIYGVDNAILEAIMDSSHWAGSQQDLVDLVLPHFLGQPNQLPIREAIDWVHASIYATIKTMKFSHMAPVCGGPIEVAVITSDRPFRWVRHKNLDAAVTHDGFSND